MLGGPDDLAEIVDSLRVDRVFVAFSARLAGADARARALAPGRARAHRHRPAPLRRRRAARDDPHARGAAARRACRPRGSPAPRALLKRAYRPRRRRRSGWCCSRRSSLIVTIAIKLDSRGPVFFRQTRIGRGDAPFTILKFRTMVENAEGLKPQLAHLNKHLLNGGDPRMFKIASDPRCTRRRPDPAALLARRAAAARERPQGRDDDRRPAAADPGGARARATAGPSGASRSSRASRASGRCSAATTSRSRR